ncbi:hypothetical protein [Alloactinosynnema sp. L-07]|nr:hypothetical protein [Alloactinosynnema sp. L-07]
MEFGRPLSTITPTLDGDVLCVLARNDATFTTGQLHRVLGRHSEEGIRKTLRRLVKQGVVTSDRVGNAFAYRLNRDHLAAEHIVGLARLAETLFSRLENRLAEWEIPPQYAAIFGSAARGSMSPDSDVDLLLVRPDDADEGEWDAQVSTLVVEMARWLGNDVRPLEFTVDEIDSRGPDEPVLLAALEDGVTVAGNRSWLAGRLRKGTH